MRASALHQWLQGGRELLASGNEESLELPEHEREESCDENQLRESLRQIDARLQRERLRERERRAGAYSRTEMDAAIPLLDLILRLRSAEVRRRKARNFVPLQIDEPRREDSHLTWRLRFESQRAMQPRRHKEAARLTRRFFYYCGSRVGGAKPCTAIVEEIGGSVRGRFDVRFKEKRIGRRIRPGERLNSREGHENRRQKKTGQKQAGEFFHRF